MLGARLRGHDGVFVIPAKAGIQTKRRFVRDSKLFKESFADKNFKDKWTQFEALRNKIAHNNLFTADDLTNGERLAQEITEIISAADAEAAKLVITSEEREAIKEQVIARSAPWREISEDVFLKELDAQEQFYADKPNGFVGLSRFVSTYLGSKGYSYASSHEMVTELVNAGIVEVYHVPNPYDEQRSTAAIRRISAPVQKPNNSIQRTRWEDARR